MGPGRSPFINRTPITIAVIESPGIPNTSAGTQAPPRLTEAVQHGLFQYFAAPAGLFAALGVTMWITGFYNNRQGEGGEVDTDKGEPS